MGANVDLMVGRLSLLYWKSYFDRYTLGLFFTDEDLVVTENVKYDELDKEETPHTEYKYSTTVQKAIDRLNSAGYTLNAVKTEFELNKEYCLDYHNLLYHLGVDFEDYDSVAQERIEKYVTFRKWKNSVRKYAVYGLNNSLFDFIIKNNDIPDGIKPKTECDKIVFHSLTDYNSESFFGCLYSAFDPLYTIRLILECIDKNKEVCVYLNEILDWSYDSIDELKIGEPTEKTIVLVEGTSDKEILEFSLKNIYPHLYNLYYFMDFEYAKDKRRQGGIDAISNNLKTFITSKLKARFIAIFDNDTIGVHAKKKLEYDIITLPENCRILNYPSIKFAKRYPTIAVNGKRVFDDINEKACSIELYLPDTFLKSEDNEFFPITWESRVQCKLGEEQLVGYQGKITEKDFIKKSFVKYKADIKNQKEQFNVDDWAKMKKLLDTIITAFD